jgi:cation-transporting ATPase E
MTAQPNPIVDPNQIAPAAPSFGGLSDEDVERLQARGEGNASGIPTSRPYIEIVRENVFNFVNTVLFFLGIVLVVLGRPSDALVSVGIVLANSLVGVVQEVRAKRTLDRIALLRRPTATVLRGGRELTVDPSAVVRGDVLRVVSGEQVVVDGRVIANSGIEIDESLLSGESRPVTKKFGDVLYSGSFCIAGQSWYEATAVGTESLVYRLTASARAFRREYTPLQRQINLIIRVVLVLAVFLEILTVVDAAINRLPVVETVLMSVVVLGLVPNGLVLAMGVAYGAAAVRIAGLGILVEHANAIESLSHADVLCLDKTGTLTTGRLEVRELHPWGIGLADLERQLGAFAASVTTPNQTIAAIARAYPGRRATVLEEVPFSSARRWSALAFDTGLSAGYFVLGSSDALETSLESSDDGRQSLVDTWSTQGLRVLLFAFHPDLATGRPAEDSPRLPASLIPLGLIGLADELRHETQSTLAAFANSGVQLKIISGDDSRTVSALARQVGFAPAVEPHDGSELVGMSPDRLAALAEEGNIFGRIAPEQKRDLILALQRNGHQVAMIGDGVNDVLALKQANLGIALGSGSSTARAVADLVLLHDSFASLPRAVREGQRVRNGMNDILKLFLTRVLTMSLLLIGTGIVGEFPLAPKHNALLTLLTVGIPAIALAAWARPGPALRQSALRQVLHFVLPAALTLTIVELGVHLAAYLIIDSTLTPVHGDPLAEIQAIATAQSAVTTVGILSGLLLLVFVEPPLEFLVGGDRLSTDWRPFLLALGLMAVYAAVLIVPSLRAFFSLMPLSGLVDLALGCVVIAWALVLRWIWRARLFERFFELGEEDLSSSATS